MQGQTREELATSWGDFIGTSLLNASRIENSTFTDYKGITQAKVNTFTSTVNQANISLGAKVRPGCQAAGYGQRPVPIER